MTQVKAHEVDRYLARPDPAHRVILVYGPDIGLVSERARLISRSSGADPSDAFSTIIIDADDAAADPSRVADEAHTISMFGGNRLVWIKGSTQKNLAGAVKPVLDLPPLDALVLIEAGDLKKTAPLRTAVEKSPSAIALPCYQDQEKAINAVIDEELSRHGLTMNSEPRALLKSLLGSDRMASRGEISKLCLYAYGNKAVTVQDITAIVGDASALALDAVIDAAATGDVATMEHTFKRLVARGMAVFQIVNAAQRHVQMLHMARSQMDEGNRPAGSVIGSLRPPINFQRKDAVTKALSIWTSAALEKMLSRLESVSLETRTNSGLAVSLASTALLAMALEARRNTRR